MRTQAAFPTWPRTWPAAAAMMMLAAFAFFHGPARAAATMAHPAIFGYGETSSPDISLFPKWTRVVTLSAPRRVAPEDCRSLPWLCATPASDARLRQLRLVNSRINDVRYRTDDRNYGTEDYWATPDQFFAHGGDCEDYAIAKYFALRELGFAADDLRIAVVRDQRAREVHAVLIAFIGAEAFVLDNKSPDIRPSRTIGHYQPYYTINENGWWLHSL